MPGSKWKQSLKRPAQYELLRKAGKPKAQAAAISNALAKKATGKKGGKRT